MQKAIKYTIFKTRWGYFGLVGTESGLLRTHLPGPRPEKIKRQLLKNLSFVNRDSRIKHQESRIEFDKTFFKTTQEQITAYFDGDCINFSRDFPIILDGFSFFISSVLTACREIRFGRTISYSGLAKKLGRPGAARAAGCALAKNPLPLIIPCHRVVRSNGKIGGFSTPGGTNLKAKLLELEKQVLMDHKTD
jgi:methylated-DNA-[protein]-cysteine S-methyltransferase